VSCTNFLTIDQALIQGKRGELSAIAMQQIEAALKLVLDLT
jgi:mRNA-degrading endonuclease toxin of MazEF toxin-antitoxin module